MITCLNTMQLNEEERPGYSIPGLSVMTLLWGMKNPYTEGLTT